MTNAPRSKERGAGMSNSSEKKKRYNIPLWCKPNLSIEEAAAYSGIGMGKLYEMTESQDCPFVLWIGSRRMIKRKVFDEFIERQYTDFIFLNRFGQPQHQSTLNKAIRRIIRDCNDEQFLKTENPEVLLPHFSCHSLRHTFTTRMCEAGVNIKVIQDTLGHKDITTTLNIYTDVTKELKRTEFDGLDKYFNNSIA